MGYLNFGKEQLINLEYSLNKEILRSNKTGAYLSTTLSGCNTRKYHGLLICPVPNPGGSKHVLLSALDETIVHGDTEFNLGIHGYRGGVYEPKGHRYLEEVEFNRVPKMTYRMGNVTLTKERLLAEHQDQVLIRYTLQGAQTKTILRFSPFLAFREIHQLSRANLYAYTKYQPTTNGISMKLYDGYPNLFMQFNKKNEFIPVPDWYYNIEYLKELNRGYDSTEDLFVPGYFEVPLKNGETLIFAAGTNAAKPRSLKHIFAQELDKRRERITFLNSLEYASEQFIFKSKNQTDIIAGFPWYSSITRQTFVALPGLCSSFNNFESCKNVLDTYLAYLKNGFFPDSITQKSLTYHAADSSLWFIWDIQQYHKRYGQGKDLWKQYGAAIKEILNAYKSSKLNYVGTTNEGLVYAEKENTPLTWMNSMAHGQPVIQRGGLPVEVNALWYNAICFALDLANLANEVEFVKKWKGYVSKTGDAFVKTFWHDGHQHLADVVRNGVADWSVRPNMVIAAAMDHTPLSREQQKSVLSVAKKHLLTARGLRSLSPDNIRYRGNVQGTPDEREMAMHQGAVWPWLLPFFVEAYLKIHKRGGLPFVKNLVEGFEDDMTEHCIGTMAELYNGNPPHQAKGAVSQAWSVAGVVLATKMVSKFEK